MKQIPTLDEIKARVRQYPERDWRMIIRGNLLLTSDIKYEALKWLDQSPKTDAMAVDGDIDDIGGM